MKVGTLTFPGSPSHGASLQMYALYTALKKMEIDVEVINYISNRVNHRKSSMDVIKAKIADIFLKNSEAAFERFESQINIYPKTPIKISEDIKALAERYDRIIVGSDQVWNPAVTGNDMNFYLEFCDDSSKKASYAPSFGVERIADADRDRIAELLSDITYLSAREERGREMIYELTGRDVPIVLDPTILVEANEWRTLKKPSGAKGEYVFVYTIKQSPKLIQTAKKFADKHGYKLVYISGGLHGVFDKFNPAKSTVSGIGPAEFLSLVDNAKYVFTNSFHGSVFSIIFNKNFFVEFSSDTNSRLKTLIQKFELEDSIIDCDSFDYEWLQRDYTRVNQMLADKRQESLSYLKEIVG